MYEEEIRICARVVSNLAKLAKLPEIPDVKFSKKERYAKASFCKCEVIVGKQLFEDLKSGRLNQDDIEVVLAHEVGHLMDFRRKLKSVYLKSVASSTAYLFLLTLLLIEILSFWSENLWMRLWAVLLFVGFLFLPYVLRKAALASQLEADKNAARLIEPEKIANSIIKRSLCTTTREFGPVGTLQLLAHTIIAPFLNERLRNLGLEIKEIDVTFKGQS